MHLIVGLGNPGKEYESTRHNVGFEVIEHLARQHHISVSKRAHQAVIGEGTIGQQRVMLARPMTYMNLSGDAVASLMRYYRIEIANIIVILDDLNLPLGKVRLRLGGSAGGQNGLAHILQRLGTQDVARIRIGIGGASGSRMVTHVLSRFHPDERVLIDESVGRAASAVETALSDGFEMAMNRFNPAA
jgi:PTH1 family peptidyl-tRNA hydrolase